MSKKVYRTMQGQTVDLGTLMLQNEHTRAVGNMKVNARGDKLNSQNQVVETRTQQVQRQNNQITTSISDHDVHTSGAAARKAAQQSITPDPVVPVADPILDIIDSTPTPVADPVTPVAEPVAPATDPVANQAQTPAPIVDKSAGLAGAIARTRQIKQELDRTRRQQAQDSGVKKI